DLNNNGICDDEEQQCDDLNNNGICDDEEQQCDDLNNNGICDDEEQQCDDLNNNGICDDEEEPVGCKQVTGSVSSDLLDAGLVERRYFFWYYTTGDSQLVWSWTERTLYVGPDGKGYTTDPGTCQ
ncbi:MAG: hypothetical protein D6B28_07545, partial [Gammaproteobacteria bacterium]